MRDVDGIALKTSERVYFPQTNTSSSSTERSISERIVSLWTIAHDEPDAIGLDEFVLKGRGISPFRDKHLQRIPALVWEAWRQVELGVPEAAALDYGLGGPFSTLTAWTSWRTGECIRNSSVRVRNLLELVGLPSESKLETDYVVTDYDAWLLGGGKIKRSDWLALPLRTVDVIRLAREPGRDLATTATELRQLSQNLGYPSEIDDGIAMEVGTISDEESRFLASLESGYVYPLETKLDPAREALLSRLVKAKARLTSERPPVSTPDNAPEETRLIRRALQREADTGKITLSAALSIARELTGTTTETLRRVEEAANGLAACGERVVGDASTTRGGNHAARQPRAA